MNILGIEFFKLNYNVYVIDNLSNSKKKIKKKLNWKLSRNLRHMCSTCYLYVRNLL